MVYLPPSEYKAFDKPPEGLSKYTNYRGYTSKTKYLFVSSEPTTIIESPSAYTTITTTKYVSFYEWWFQHRGKWYMHLNEYLGGKKGQNFAHGFAKPTQAWWVDADGNKWEYVHPNKAKKGAKK